MNKMVGLGFGGIPDARILDEIEQTCSASGFSTNVELCTLTDPGGPALLTDRGYRIAGVRARAGCSLDRRRARVRSREPTHPKAVQSEGLSS